MKEAFERTANLAKYNGAHSVGEHNRAVTILEMRLDIAMDEEMIPRGFLMPRLEEWGIQKIVNATVQEITDDGVVYTDADL